MGSSAQPVYDTSQVPQYEAPSAVIGDYVNRSTAPNYRYDDAPEYARGAYHESPVAAWAPSDLRVSAEGIPDAHRLRTMPLYDYRPNPSRAPEEFWNRPGGPEFEQQQRHTAAETVDGDGWEMTRGDMTRKRAAPDVRRTPPPEPRPTNRMAPVTYSFTRPFDQHSARRLNGQHFSMADHRRTYEIYGMAPIGSRRNTYRADPQPWDTDIVDSAPDYNPTYARIQQVEVPDAAGRSWRL